MGELILKEVLYLPGMRVNIFSLQSCRNKEHEYSFTGKPHPGRVIPIFNSEGRQISSMKESLKGKPNLIWERVKEGKRVDMDAEVLGAKGIHMELLHKRLGHTSQTRMERLVCGQMV